MARIRLIILAVLAVFCVSAVASAVATASENGELVNSAGTALIKNKFTGTSGETELVAATSIKCKHDTATGIITSKTGGEMTVTFKECTAAGLSCTGGGGGAGVIIVLVGLQLRKNVGHTADLILTAIIPQKGAGAAELEIVCTGVKIKVKGSFLSQPITLGNLSKDYTLVAKNKSTEQEPTEYERELPPEKSGTFEKVKEKGLESNTEGGAFGPSAEKGSEIVLFEEEAKFL